MHVSLSKSENPIGCLILLGCLFVLWTFEVFSKKYTSLPGLKFLFKSTLARGSVVSDRPLNERPGFDSRRGSRFLLCFTIVYCIFF